MSNSGNGTMDRTIDEMSVLEESVIKFKRMLEEFETEDQQNNNDLESNHFNLKRSHADDDTNTFLKEKVNNDLIWDRIRDTNQKWHILRGLASKIKNDTEFEFVNEELKRLVNKSLGNC